MEKKLILLALIPLLVFWHWFDPAAKKNQEGIEAYSEKKFEKALQDFLSAKGENPDLAALKNNTASTLYQLKKYQQALEEFSKIDFEKSGISKADLLYNMGNTYFRLKQYHKALESYKNSLILDPEDLSAKKNYEITLKKLKNQKEKNQPNRTQKKNQEKKNRHDRQMDKNRERRHQQLMRYLNQNEMKQMKKRKRRIAAAKTDKDW